MKNYKRVLGMALYVLCGLSAVLFLTGCGIKPSHLPPETDEKSTSTKPADNFPAVYPAKRGNADFR